MCRPTSVVRRNDSRRGLHGLDRFASLKEKQHGRATRIESNEAFARQHRRRAQQLPVESGGSLKILAIQSCFEHSLNACGHRTSSTGGGMKSTWSGSRRAPHGGVVRVAAAIL